MQIVAVRRKYDREALLAEHPTVRAWYDSHKSAPKNWRDIPRFMEWRERMGYSSNPEEWIEECLKGTNETLTRHATVIKSWVESSEFAGDRHSARKRYAASMAGFYLTHMVRLPPIRVSATLSDSAEVEVQMTASKHLEMLKTVLTCGRVSLRAKALMMCQTQGGMDASTLADVFNFQAYAQLSKHFGTERFEEWDPEKVPVRVDLVRPKTGVRHFTFLHHDAVLLLKQHLGKRVSDHGPVRVHPPRRPTALPTSDPIFVNNQGAPLRRVNVYTMWKVAGMQAGVNVVPQYREERGKGGRRRYPFHSHESRDTLKTLCRRERVDVVVADLCVGHDIDPNQYDKSPWDDDSFFREGYDKVAGTWLNLITGAEARIKRDYDTRLERELSARDKQLQELLDFKESMMRMLGMPEAQRLIGKGAKVEPDLLRLRSEDLPE